MSLVKVKLLRLFCNRSILSAAARLHQSNTRDEPELPACRAGKVGLKNDSTDCCVTCAPLPGLCRGKNLSGKLRAASTRELAGEDAQAGGNRRASAAEASTRLMIEGVTADCIVTATGGGRAPTTSLKPLMVAGEVEARAEYLSQTAAAL